MTVLEITPMALGKIIQEEETAGDLLLLDVREPWEFAITHIPGSINMPLGTLCDNAYHLPKNRAIITICHHGVRSLRACLILQKDGITRVKSLRGGIDLYTRTCDGTLKLY